MARLDELGGSGSITLLAHTLVGRDSAAGLRIEDPSVSSVHASLHWDGEGWWLRDLGSSNGTVVDGQAVRPGQDVRLSPGAEICFGGGSVRWTLSDTSAPVALARSGSIVVLAEEGLLLLPSADDPEVVVYQDAEDGWVCERETGRTVLSEGQWVDAGGRRWEVALPRVREATFGPEEVLPDIEDVHARFEVSQDEEFVRITLEAPGWRAELAPRSYHYLLVTLARLRDDDDPDSGWVHRDDLAAMLRVSPRTLTVHLCRARQQLAEAGVVGAQDLIEHRPAQRQLRLGLRRFEVTRLRR